MSEHEGARPAAAATAEVATANVQAVPAAPTLQRQSAVRQIHRSLQAWRSPSAEGEGDEGESAEGGDKADEGEVAPEATAQTETPDEAAPKVAAKRQGSSARGGRIGSSTVRQALRKVMRSTTPPPGTTPAGPNAEQLAQMRSLELAADAIKKRNQAILAASAGGVPGPEAMHASAQITQFVAAAKTIFKDWDMYQTPEARIRMMAFAASDTLTAAGVPTPVVVADDAETSFRAGAWRLSISKQSYSAKPANEDKAANIASTVYHEARHAEQYFNVARMLAGKGKNATEIAAEVPGGIPPRIAAEACLKPMPPTDPDCVQFQRILDALRDPATKKLTEDILDKVFAAGRATMAAIAAGRANAPDAQTKSDEAKAAWLIANPLVEQQKRLDPEVDAYGIENLVKAAFKA